MENFGKVVVVAPDRERSGSGCSTSIYQTICCREIWSGQVFYGYALSGTPVDCVMIGVKKLFGNDKPDMIVSGINTGANLGRDIFYSGTVGAAMEGAFHDIFSMAISIDQKENVFLSTATSLIEKIIQTLPSEIHKQSKLLNINIPNLAYSEVKGFRLTKLAHIFHQKLIKSLYKSGYTQYFWIEGSQPEGMTEEKSDYWAIRNHFVSITALSLEFEHDHDKDKHVLEKWIHNLNI